MLLALEVRDFVIVDHLALEFERGFTVLTGETGAGKSILIDALGLVLGARPDPGVVRSGCERAEISATFTLPAGEPAGAQADASDREAEDADAAPGSVAAWLAEQGFADEEGQLLLRRSLDAGGRSRCWINGRSATTQQLRTLGAALLDIHGQHAHQSLLRPIAQRALLDAYAGADGDAALVRAAWQRWQTAESALASHAQRGQALAAEREQLAREADELMAVALSPQAWTELQLEQGRLAHAHSLLSSAQWGVERLADGEDDVMSSLHGISQRLGELETIDEALRAPRELIEGAAIALGEAVHTLRRYAHAIESDPERLVAVEDQMQRIMACARRYRLAPEAIEVRLDELRARLAGLSEEASLGHLQRECSQAQADYAAAAARLSALRASAAARLGATVTATIRDLAMGEGVFSIALRPQAGGSAAGDEQVEFCLAAFPGQPAGPLARIASGGELSRVSLAVQTALSRVSRVPTLIFDEVDTGIGGRVAEIVGRLLHQLAADCQVMCVTHLAQVAACADHHLQVSRTSLQGVPVSRIQALTGGDRVDEIARMLGGASLTDTSRQHARELLGTAQAAR